MFCCQNQGSTSSTFCICHTAPTHDQVYTGHYPFSAQETESMSSKDTKTIPKSSQRK